MLFIKCLQYTKHYKNDLNIQTHLISLCNGHYCYSHLTDKKTSLRKFKLLATGYPGRGVAELESDPGRLTLKSDTSGAWPLARALGFSGVQAPVTGRVPTALEWEQ